MDTWIVGKTPIGVFQPPKDTPTAQETTDVSTATVSKMSYLKLFLALCIFLQSAHNGRAGAPSQGEHHKLCLVDKGGNRATCEQTLLGEH